MPAALEPFAASDVRVAIRLADLAVRTAKDAPKEPEDELLDAADAWLRELERAGRQDVRAELSVTGTLGMNAEQVRQVLNGEEKGQIVATRRWALANLRTSFAQRRGGPCL